MLADDGRMCLSDDWQVEKNLERDTFSSATRSTGCETRFDFSPGLTQLDILRITRAAEF